MKLKLSQIMSSVRPVDAAILQQQAVANFESRMADTIAMMLDHMIDEDGLQDLATEHAGAAMMLSIHIMSMLLHLPPNDLRLFQILYLNPERTFKQIADERGLTKQAVEQHAGQLVREFPWMKRIISGNGESSAKSSGIPEWNIFRELQQATNRMSPLDRMKTDRALIVSTPNGVVTSPRGDIKAWFGTDDAHLFKSVPEALNVSKSMPDATIFEIKRINNE